MSIVVVNPPNLAELAETINREHGRVLEARRNLIEHAMIIGEALIAARQQLEQAAFWPWVQANSGISKGAACRYMRISHYREHLDGAESVQDAHDALVGLPPMSETGRGRYAVEKKDAYLLVHELAATGVPKKQISQQVGIHTNTVHRYLNIEADRAARRRRADHSRQEQRDQRKNQKRLHLDRAAKKAGGGISESYSRIRLTAETLDALCRAGATPEIRLHAGRALRLTYRAEEEIVKLLGLS